MDQKDKNTQSCARRPEGPPPLIMAGSTTSLPRVTRTFQRVSCRTRMMLGCSETRLRNARRSPRTTVPTVLYLRAGALFMPPRAQQCTLFRRSVTDRVQGTSRGTQLRAGPAVLGHAGGGSGYERPGAHSPGVPRPLEVLSSTGASCRAGARQVAAALGSCNRPAGPASGQRCSRPFSPKSPSVDPSSPAPGAEHKVDARISPRLLLAFHITSTPLCLSRPRPSSHSTLGLLQRLFVCRCRPPLLSSLSSLSQATSAQPLDDNPYRHLVSWPTPPIHDLVTETADVSATLNSLSTPATLPVDTHLSTQPGITRNIDDS